MIFKTASRYAFSRRNRHFARSVRIALTLAVSVAILMTVLSVMGALQEKRFRDIRDIKSFDIIADTEDVGLVRELYPDMTVFPYWEEMVLSDGQSYTVRYIDETYDGGVEYMNEGGKVLVPYDWYRAGGGWRDLVITRLGEGAGKLPKAVSFRPDDIYMTKMRAFDMAHIFLDINDRGRFARPKVAVKGTDDKTLLSENGIEAKTWKESESTLYSAFILENFMMKLTLSILFLIVIISLRQSVMLFLSGKRKERAEFAVLGLEKRKIRLVFILSFLIITLTGLSLGLALSFIAIPVFESIVNSRTIGGLALSFDWGLYFTLAISMAVLTVIISWWYMRKEERLTLTEVIHG